MNASLKPFTAEVNAKQSIKRQLYTTHLGVVGWEPHSSSTTTCAGKVDQLFRPYGAHQCHSLLSVIIDSRFFLPLEQLRTALLSYHLAASRVFLGVFSFDLPIRPRAPQNNPRSSLTPKTHKN